MTTHPIFVDLDGTLIHADMLHESALRMLRDSPWELLRFPGWLLQGKAVLKRKLADLTEFDATLLPYNQELLGWLRQQKADGRRLILCTASDHVVASSIADHLQIFDEVMASDGSVNLAGRHKAAALEQRFGLGGFDYAGNSRADLAVWRCSRRAIVVYAPEGWARQAEGLCGVDPVIPAPVRGLTVWRRVLRVHPWRKNLLLLVPVLAAHQIFSAEAWVSLVVAFLAFSLCASSVYIANDLLDLDSDRIHPRKRKRPFASGQVPVWMGVALAPVLFLSLAFVKRYAELHSQLASGNEKVHGRGCYTSDSQPIQTFGITSSCASVVVLALYLNSDAVVQLYRPPQVMWGAVPLVLFWVSWMWMQAHRGLMRDDPLVFAVKDRASLISGAVFVVVMGVGALGWPW
jgi:phosphoserine phosphatase